MGFFGSGGKATRKDAQPSLELIHRLQCKVCPLDKADNCNPHMRPAGSKSPLIYILGDAPGKIDDEEDGHFLGEGGQVLRHRLPKALLAHVRWNNVVRTRPPKGRDPEYIEIEACRPSVEADIVATKPKAIFGFGPVPLHWVTGQATIKKWRGKRFPVEIAGHQCWYYAFEHPTDLLRRRRRNGDISEDERAFRFDLARAIDEVETTDPPTIIAPGEADKGVECLPCTDAGLDRLAELLAWAAKQPVVGVDYETNALRPYGKPIMNKDRTAVERWEDSKILSAAVGTPTKSFAFAFDHKQAKWSKDQRARLVAMWVKFLRAPGVRKAVHKLAFEMEWTAYFFGYELLWDSEWDCTYTQAVLLDERSMADDDASKGFRTGGASLDDLVWQHWGLALKAQSPLDRNNLDSEPLGLVLRYNGMDAKFHAMLCLEQRGRLEAQRLQEVYLRDDLPRVPTMVLTQLKGLPRSQAVTVELQTKYRARALKAEKAIEALPEVAKFEKIYKRKYNPMSNKDCVIMFRDVLGRDEGYDKGASEKREDGQVMTWASNAPYAVDKAVLEKIGGKLAEHTIELRESNKRLSTYIDAYADGSPFIWPDGLIHPIINPQGTKSGRSSSEDPNIQNIPKRDEEAKEVRRQVTPANDNDVVVAIDYGQIQARGIAMMSRDKAFVRSLWDRYDVHTEWAERIASAYPERIGGRQFLKDKKVMKDFRGDVKNQWTFPLFFGAKLYGISQFLQIPQEVLEPIMEEFWDMFHGVAEWHQELLADYREFGYVKHLNGRINRAPLSFNQMINYPIQGLEADIVLDAYTQLSRKAHETGDRLWQPNLEIHDDLTWIVPANKVDQYVEGMVRIMLGVKRPYINVPLTVEVSVGPNLLELEEVFKASSDEEHWAA